MKTILFLMMLIFKDQYCAAQKVVYELRFIPKFGTDELVLNRKYVLKGDSISISKFRFYISDLVFLQDEKVVYAHKEKNILIDTEGKLTIRPTMDVGINFSAIRFSIGIDSLTNVSGAMGGDLDATNGMYWTWQSGYINVKLEGNSNICKARNQSFQFHIGGYANPYATLQQVILPARKKGVELLVIADLMKLFIQINLASSHTVLSPGPNAVMISKQFKEIFSTQP